MFPSLTDVYSTSNSSNFCIKSSIYSTNFPFNYKSFTNFLVHCKVNWPLFRLFIYFHVTTLLIKTLSSTMLFFFHQFFFELYQHETIHSDFLGTLKLVWPIVLEMSSNGSPNFVEIISISYPVEYRIVLNFCRNCLKSSSNSQIVVEIFV